jgi:hypothetical protein
LNDKGGLDLDGLKKFAVSDSIIITIPYNKEGAAAKIFNKVTQLSYDILIAYKHLIRGGIACGELYYDHDNTIIFGKAFLESVRLEKEAEMPRVLISDSIVSELREKEVAADYPPKWVSISEVIFPDKYYLDYIRAVFSKQGNFEYSPDKIAEHITIIDTFIQKNLAVHSNNE